MKDHHLGDGDLGAVQADNFHERVGRVILAANVEGGGDYRRGVRICN